MTYSDSDRNRNLADDTANAFWISYLDQYETAIWCLIGDYESNEGHLDIYLPILFLFSQYIELWAKTIEQNFGVGVTEDTSLNIFGQHYKKDFFASVSKSLTQHEANKFSKSLQEIASIYNKIERLTANGSNLNEAMRYPVTRKAVASINKNILLNLDFEEAGFQFSIYLSKVKRVMELTRAVFDSIYEDRFHIKRGEPT